MRACKYYTNEVVRLTTCERKTGKGEKIREMDLSVINKGDARIISMNYIAERLELAAKAIDGTSRSYLTLCPILYRGFHLIHYVAV